MTRPPADTPPTLLRVAHRGASGHAPENTLAAFRLALELGTDAIELDLRPTRDAQVVVLHDETVDRTTSGRGRLADLTLAEVERLDAGSWFGSRFRGERIPRLADVLELAGRYPIRLLLELKTHGSPGDAWIARAVEEVRRAGLLGRVTFLSFDASALEQVKRQEKAATTGWLVTRVPLRVERKLGALGATVLAARWTSVNAGLVRRAHAAGYSLVVWTVDAPAAMRRLIALGVDALATNFPDRLNAVLGRAGTPSG